MTTQRLFRTFTWSAALLIGLSVVSQTRSGHLFIEPCLSFSYDTAAFRIGERFSNTAYHTEGYEVLPTGKLGGRFVVDAMRSDRRTSQSERDSLVALAIAEGNKLDNGVVSVHKPGIAVHHKAFTGAGMVLRAKEGSSYAINFMGGLEFDGCVCNVAFSRMSSEAIDTYETDLALLYVVIDGLTGHSGSELAARDSLLVPSVKITVERIARPASTPSYIKANYFGIVKVTGTDALRVKEASIPYDPSGTNTQLLSPNEAGDLIIHFNDPDKGTIEKDCELIMLDELDRDVRIPFLVTYQNP